MYDFKEFLVSLSENSKVEFKLVADDNTVLFNSLNNVNDSEIIESELYLSTQRATLIMHKGMELCTSLLKYSIETKYQEIFSLREQLVIDMLEGKGVSTEALYSALPFISHKCTLFLLSVDKNRYDALNIVKQSYDGQDVLTTIYKDYILIAGRFEEEIEHATGIRDAILSDVSSRCYISYSNFQGGAEEFKRAFNDALTCIILAKKYDIKHSVYNSENLLFEKTIYNVSEVMKTEIYNTFKEKFIRFDSEMINTIEEFINCGLNISEASKKLYIHRNTLIYRLDKIAKDTGFDIRDFKQANIFTIAFLIWKERKH